MGIGQFEIYKQNRDPAIREKLILEYVPLVKIVAGRLAVRFYGHVGVEDLESYGIFGLMDAIEKFDSDKGVKFETYATLRIRGAIMDNIRKMDWVSRSARQENKKLEKIYLELEHKLGREPTDEEIAGQLGISVKEVRNIISKVQLSTLVSFDDLVEKGYDPAEVSSRSGMDSGPEAKILEEERKQLLIEAISKLTEKERLVVNLYYYEELTLKEISMVMKVSESRVSQIHSKAIMKLKLKLGSYFVRLGW